MRNSTKSNVTSKDKEDYKKLISENEHKIQIRIPLWVNAVLENDMSAYNLIQGATPNMTMMVSRVLSSVNEYRKHERETKLKILELGDRYAADFYNAEIVDEELDDRLADISSDETLFINGITTLLNNEDTKDLTKGTVRIDIHKTLSNASILLAISELCNENLTIGMYIKNILEWYALQVGYKREQILFARTIKDIKKVLKSSPGKVYYYDIPMKKGHIVAIKPYALEHDQNGIHNYLLGITKYIDKNTNEFVLKPTTLRIDNIVDNLSDVFCIHDEYKSEEFSNEEIDILNLMIKNNPAYAYRNLKPDLYKLRFDSLAMTKYNQIYLQRPKYIEKLENKNGTVDLTFDCATQQLNSYMIRLMTSFNNYELESPHIEILEPQGFKDNFKDYYLQFAKTLKI